MTRSDAPPRPTATGVPSSERELRLRLLEGPRPAADGWSWAYRAFDAARRRAPFVGRLACGWLWPRRIERDDRAFRLLGVAAFGRLVPTGGVAVRRLTRARMAPYTLRGPSPRAAREFFYRTCIFELLHLPFLLALLAISLQRWTAGRPDLAMEDLVVNLVANVYPVLHHRRTRARIVGLLLRQRPARGQGRK